MTGRFQFSLGRSLIAIGLLCVASAAIHQALRVEAIGPPSPTDEVVILAPVWGDVRYTVALMGTGGACCALAIGVLARRTPWCAIGAILGIAPCLWYLCTQRLWTPTW
jgi:hypothetical protein